MPPARDFCFVDAFADEIGHLRRSHVERRPCSLVSSQWLRQPRALCGLGGRCRYLGGGHVARIVLDFGDTVVGMVNLSLSSDGSARLRMRYGEDLTEALRDAPFPAPWVELPEDAFALHDGTHALRSHGRRAFRYLRIEIEAESDGELHDVVVDHAHHPVEERGHFACSDPLLVRAWDIGVNTTRLCMQRYYEDGVKRDGLLWLGDFRAQYLFNVFTFADRDLARETLRLVARSQRGDGSLPACAAKGGGHQHPQIIDYMGRLPTGPDDWDLINYYPEFLNALHEYAAYGEDETSLRALWPFAARLIAYIDAEFDPRELDCPRNMLTDNQYDADGAWWGSPATACMQLYEGLGHGGELAERLADAESAERCRRGRERLAALIAEEHYDAELRLYGERLADGGFDASWHANACAVLAGVVDRDEGRRLLERARMHEGAREPVCSLMMFYLLRALFLVDLDTLALDWLRAYWGAMLEAGASTCWERLDLRHGLPAELDHPISHCHGWGAGPCYLLPVHVLGVQRQGADWSHVRIRPRRADLDWAEGCVPTPRGDIFVHWQRGGDALTGVVDVPAGITAEVEMPDGHRYAVAPGERRRIDEGWVGTQRATRGWRARSRGV